MQVSSACGIRTMNHHKPPAPPEARDVWIYRFIAVSVVAFYGISLYINANNGGNSDIPTDLLAGFVGAVVAYYFGKSKK